MAVKTYGDKPLSFQLEENGEYYCIGSEVMNIFYSFKIIFFYSFSVMFISIHIKFNKLNILINTSLMNLNGTRFPNMEFNIEIFKSMLFVSLNFVICNH